MRMNHSLIFDRTITSSIANKFINSLTNIVEPYFVLRISVNLIYLVFRFNPIDKSGKIVLPIKYNKVGLFSEGLAVVDISGQKVFIDKTGKVIISLEKYNLYGAFKEGLAPVEYKNRYGFIDKTGKLVIPLEFDDAFSFRYYYRQFRKWCLFGGCLSFFSYMNIISGPNSFAVFKV